MVRTKADGGGRKAVAAKAPRKVLGGGGGGNAGPSFSSPKAGKVDKYAGGNVACPRPTPDWQKGISGFFVTSPPKPAAEGDREKENSEPRPSQTMDAEECSGQASSQGSSAQDSGSSSSQSPGKSSSPVKQRNGIISDSDED